MMALLVLTSLGLIVLQWYAMITTSAPNMISVMLAGKHHIITKETNSFFTCMLEEVNFHGYFVAILNKLHTLLLV